MTDPERHVEPLTPVYVETKLRSLVNQLTGAQRALSDARDLETEAEITLKRARLRASHDAACPQPQRGGPTVAEREAWIEAAVADDWEVHRRAVAGREIAVDALRTTREIASVVQTLARSVQQAYQMAGHS